MINLKDYIENDDAQLIMVGDKCIVIDSPYSKEGDYGVMISALERGRTPEWLQSTYNEEIAARRKLDIEFNLKKYVGDDDLWVTSFRGELYILDRKDKSDEDWVDFRSLILWMMNNDIYGQYIQQAIDLLSSGECLHKKNFIATTRDGWTVYFHEDGEVTWGQPQ